MSATENQFKDLPEIYCRAWANRDPSDLLSLFADDSKMTDHGAQLHVPKNFLERHHRHWNGAHDKFEVYLEYVIFVYSGFPFLGTESFVLFGKAFNVYEHFVKTCFLANKHS